MWPRFNTKQNNKCRLTYFHMNTIKSTIKKDNIKIINSPPKNINQLFLPLLLPRTLAALINSDKNLIWAAAWDSGALLRAWQV